MTITSSEIRKFDGVTFSQVWVTAIAKRKAFAAADYLRHMGYKVRLVEKGKTDNYYLYAFPRVNAEESHYAYKETRMR